MDNQVIAAAILTKTIVEASPSLRDAIERRVKKNEYSAMAADVAVLYGEVLRAIDAELVEEDSAGDGDISF